MFVFRFVRNMPISVSSFNARIRDSCDEAPPSKRMCSSYVSFEKVEAENRSQSAEVVDLDAFGPRTPTKEDEECELAPKTSGGWNTLEFPLLERVSLFLSASDLCRLSQVIL